MERDEKMITKSGFIETLGKHVAITQMSIFDIITDEEYEQLKAILMNISDRNQRHNVIIDIQLRG